MLSSLYVSVSHESKVGLDSTLKSLRCARPNSNWCNLPKEYVQSCNFAKWSTSRENMSNQRAVVVPFSCFSLNARCQRAVLRLTMKFQMASGLPKYLHALSLELHWKVLILRNICGVNYPTLVNYLGTFPHKIPKITFVPEPLLYSTWQTQSFSLVLKIVKHPKYIPNGARWDCGV